MSVYPLGYRICMSFHQLKNERKNPYSAEVKLMMSQRLKTQICLQFALCDYHHFLLSSLSTFYSQFRKWLKNNVFNCDIGQLQPDTCIQKMNSSVMLPDANQMAKGPSIKYITLEGGGDPRKCESL